MFSIERLAIEAGLEADRIRYILRNPLYNGWMRRHRGPDELRVEAPWRADPPVSDALWSRVVDVRASRTRGGGPRNRGRTDLLAGLLVCVCGRRIRSDGRLGITNHIAKLHLEPCPAWGQKARLNAATWECPILEQIGGLRIDDAMVARVVSVLASDERPVTMDRARIERQLRDVALDHAAGRISDETYLARVRELRSALGDLDRETSAPASSRAVEWLRMFAQTWHEADIPEARAELLHAIYDRIVVAGPRFVRTTLTPAAYQHGLALALPQAVMARPEVSEFTT